MCVSFVLRLVLSMFFSLVRKFSTKMVIIVRTDIKMSHGKVATQCAHAAVSLYTAALKSQQSCLQSWWLCGQPKIILKLDSEQALHDVYSKAQNAGLNACLIYDAGKTQIEPGTLTVVGLGPNKSEQIDELTKNFKLL